MSTKYDDRDRDRNQRNYGRRSRPDYDRSYRAFDDEDRRYAGESRLRGQYGTGRALYRGGGDYESRDWGNEGEDDRYLREQNRSYGSSDRGGEYGRGYSGGASEKYGETHYGDEYGSNYGGGFERGEGQYRDTPDSYSQRSSYPGGYRSGESYGQRARSYGDYNRGRYGEGRRYGQDRDWYEDRGGYEGRGYEGRDRYREGEERGWWDRFSDTVASWFGDEEAERRRQMERPYQGRGPKGYRRSDDRIREDVNDRLSEGYLDASEVEVMVTSGEVVLTGTVNSRSDKRRAEDIAENVSGVTNVENRLRVRDRQQLGGTYGISEGASLRGSASMGSSTTGTSATGTGTTGTTATGTGTTGSTGTTSGNVRGKTAGS